MVRAFERIFAGELTLSDYIILKEGYGKCLISPTGALCAEVFLSGTITEVICLSKEKMRLRFSDSTGVLLIDCTLCSNEERLMVERLPIPSFISFTGSPSIYQRKLDEILLIDAFSIKNISRRTRDLCTIRAANITLRRIEALNASLVNSNSINGQNTYISHYSLKQADILVFLKMIKTALKSVKNVQTIIKPADEKEFLLEIISKQGGKKGIEVQEVVNLASAEGFSEEETLSNIGLLIAEDEIYQPQKGFVKIL